MDSSSNHCTGGLQFFAFRGVFQLVPLDPQTNRRSAPQTLTFWVEIALLLPHTNLLAIQTFVPQLLFLLYFSSFSYMPCTAPEIQISVRCTPHCSFSTWNAYSGSFPTSTFQHYLRRRATTPRLALTSRLHP